MPDTNISPATNRHLLLGTAIMVGLGLFILASRLYWLFTLDGANFIGSDFEMYFGVVFTPIMLLLAARQFYLRRTSGYWITTGLVAFMSISMMTMVGLFTYNDTWSLALANLSSLLILELGLPLIVGVSLAYILSQDGVREAFGVRSRSADKADTLTLTDFDEQEEALEVIPSRNENYR